MTKQLHFTFLRGIGWIIGSYLTVVSALAGTTKPAAADTCRHPEPPVLTGSAASVCRYEAVTLSATGCVGTVVWSTGDTGPTLTVRPAQSTTYTAICRLKPGCISCFSEPYLVTVKTPSTPAVTASATRVCPGDPVTLTASGCAGTVRWLDPDDTELGSGSTYALALTQSAVFRAVCEQNQCLSSASRRTGVEVAIPAVPLVAIDKSTICLGQAVQLTASGCLGTVRWSDGTTGITTRVKPVASTTYKAVCQIGTCQSDSSAGVRVEVQPSDKPLILLTSLQNSCPLMTADLTKAIRESDAANQQLRYSFRKGTQPDAPAVQSPTAVLAGTYYIIGQDENGCLTEPKPVLVSISACANAVPPCLSSPATVRAWIDSLNWSAGVVTLRGKLGGSAERIEWQSSGEGLFTDARPATRYLLSEQDRQRGTVTFTVQVPDPDGNGPCAGASAQLTAQAPHPELIGLSMAVSEPLWLTGGKGRLVELTYRLSVVNSGRNPLQHVQLSNNLETAFGAVGARLEAVTVRADAGLLLNAAYTGRGADTTLLRAGNQLLPAARASLWITIRLAVDQAQTLTFTNQALAWATDLNGTICRDQSTSGVEADPDRNQDPTDNSEPTRVTIHSLPPGEATTALFIPEGFSPNNDGINDRFVIQQVPPGVSIRLDVYNRWGQLVYRQNDYKNDWDGTANQGSAATARQGLPDGTYYYQVQLSDGREFSRVLTLMR